MAGDVLPPPRPGRYSLLDRVIRAYFRRTALQGNETILLTQPYDVFLRSRVFSVVDPSFYTFTSPILILRADHGERCAEIYCCYHVHRFHTFPLCPELSAVHVAEAEARGWI